MRISTFLYCLKEGIKNICRNVWFSLASVATISACIFLFCLFFSIVVNIQHVVKNVEGTIGITVFFDDELSEEEMQARNIEIIPFNLCRAVEAMEADPFIREVLGNHVFSKYVEAKKAEWDLYRKQVTQWEIDEYLYKI